MSAYKREGHTQSPSTLGPMRVLIAFLPLYPVLLAQKFGRQAHRCVGVGVRLTLPEIVFELK